MVLNKLYTSKYIKYNIMNAHIISALVVYSFQKWKLFKYSMSDSVVRVADENIKLCKT